MLDIRIDFKNENRSSCLGESTRGLMASLPSLHRLLFGLSLGWADHGKVIIFSGSTSSLRTPRLYCGQDWPSKDFDGGFGDQLCARLSRHHPCQLQRLHQHRQVFVGHHSRSPPSYKSPILTEVSQFNMNLKFQVFQWSWFRPCHRHSVSLHCRNCHSRHAGKPQIDQHGSCY